MYKKLQRLFSAAAVIRPRESPDTGFLQEVRLCTRRSLRDHHAASRQILVRQRPIQQLLTRYVPHCSSPLPRACKCACTGGGWEGGGGWWLGTAPSTATKQHRALLRTVACMCRRYVRWAAASHTRCADTTRASKVGHRRWRLQRRHPCSRQQAVQHNSQASQSIDLQGMECVGWRSALVIQQVCVCVCLILVGPQGTPALVISGGLCTACQGASQASIHQVLRCHHAPSLVLLLPSAARTSHWQSGCS